MCYIYDAYDHLVHRKIRIHRICVSKNPVDTLSDSQDKRRCLFVFSKHKCVLKNAVLIFSGSEGKRRCLFVLIYKCVLKNAVYILSDNEGKRRCLFVLIYNCVLKNAVYILFDNEGKRRCLFVSIYNCVLKNAVEKLFDNKGKSLRHRSGGTNILQTFDICGKYYPLNDYLYPADLQRGVGNPHRYRKI